jgi:hypothetical protein
MNAVTNGVIAPAGAGKGGIVPPEDKRFKPGNKAAANQDTANAIAKNYLNGMARRETKASELRRIIADDTKPPLMQAAAEQILNTRRRTTLADFDPWIEGKKTLEQLAAAGVDVSLVKRAKIGNRVTRISVKGNQTIEEGERSIELFDQSGNNLDRIINHTGPTADLEEKNRQTRDDGLLPRGNVQQLAGLTARRVTLSLLPDASQSPEGIVPNKSGRRMTSTRRGRLGIPATLRRRDFLSTRGSRDDIVRQIRHGNPRPPRELSALSTATSLPRLFSKRVIEEAQLRELIRI